MKRAADKVHTALGDVPKRTFALRRIMTEVGQTNGNANSNPDECCQRLHERVRKFVFGDSQRDYFPPRDKKPK